MSDFSLLVRKKYESLDSEQKLMFDEEYKRRKKSFGDNYNNDLALDILRDIALTFGKDNSIQENKDVVENITERKSYGNISFPPPNKKYNKSYLFNYIYVLILAFIGISAYTKPTKAKMENYIINKFLEAQPQFVKFFKNIFLGEEVTQEKAEGFMYNALKNNGYEVSFKDSDFLILKKIEIIDSLSQKNLLVAYGFLGKTFITYKAEDVEINPSKNRMNSYNYNNSDTSRESINYEKIKKLDYDPNYWKKSNNTYEEPTTKIEEESKNSNRFSREREENTDNELKSEPTEDSIKI